MNPALTILTSVVVAAVVASVFNLIGQAAEREARRRELIFQKAFDLAQQQRTFLMEVADKTGKTTTIADYVAYSEMCYWLLEHLFDDGKLPDGWRTQVKEMGKATGS